MVLVFNWKDEIQVNFLNGSDLKSGITLNHAPWILSRSHGFLAHFHELCGSNHSEWQLRVHGFIGACDGVIIFGELIDLNTII